MSRARIAEFLTHLEKARDQSPNTIKAYGRDLDAFADFLDQLVTPDPVARLLAPAPGPLGRQHRRREKIPRAVMRAQQRLHRRPQPGIVAARAVQIRRAPVHR